jgi:hypothetical protein
MLEHCADARDMAKILMRDDPSVERSDIKAGQDGPEAFVSIADWPLNSGDTHPGAGKIQRCWMAIGPEHKGTSVHPR